MRCKYCKREIEYEDGRWRDKYDYSLCFVDPSATRWFHAPEDSASTLADEIEQKIAEAHKTLAEIERLTAKLKEAR